MKLRLPCPSLPAHPCCVIEIHACRSANPPPPPASPLNLTDVAIDDRHFLSVAFNVHMASGPVVALMSFRKNAVGRSREGLLQGEQMPWHDVQFYERKSRKVMTLYRKSRWVLCVRTYAHVSHIKPFQIAQSDDTFLQEITVGGGCCQSVLIHTYRASNLFFCSHTHNTCRMTLPVACAGIQLSETFGRRPSSLRWSGRPGPFFLWLPRRATDS